MTSDLRQEFNIFRLLMAVVFLCMTRTVIAVEAEIGGTGAPNEGFVRSVGASNLHFKTGPGVGTTNVAVMTTGNIGIGTTNPDGLQVNIPVSETAQGVDNVRMGIAAGTPRLIFEDSASATLWEFETKSGALIIRQPAGEILTLTSAPSLYTTNWSYFAAQYGSGWTDYANTFQWPQYKKVGDLVFLRGLATSNGNAWASYPTILTLPAGLRPPAQEIFGPTGNANAPVRVDINSAGTVWWVAGGAGSGWIGLDGIVFSVDP